MPKVNEPIDRNLHFNNFLKIVPPRLIAYVVGIVECKFRIRGFRSGANQFQCDLFESAP